MKHCNTCKYFRVKADTNRGSIGKCDNDKVCDLVSLSVMELFFKTSYGLSNEAIRSIIKDSKEYQILRFDGGFGCIFHEEYNESEDEE